MQRTIYLITILTLLAANLAGAATKYVIKDLGALPGDNSGCAEAINNKGQIIGISRRISDGSERLFLRDAGRLSEIRVRVSPDGAPSIDISDSGLIVASIGDESFILEKGKVSKIAAPKGYSIFCATRINARGDVLGLCFGPDYNNTLFIRCNGVMQPVKMSAGDMLVNSGTLNNKGQVALNIEKADGEVQTALWENGKLTVVKGVPESFRAHALTDDGAMVGTYSAGEESFGGIWRNGKMTRLKAPEDLSMPEPRSINKDGVIVGWCFLEEMISIPVVWDKSGVPSLLPTLGGGEGMAADINDAGQIVGSAADRDGNPHAVIWTPVK